MAKKLIDGIGRNYGFGKEVKQCTKLVDDFIKQSISEPSYPRPRGNGAYLLRKNNKQRKKKKL